MQGSRALIKLNHKVRLLALPTNIRFGCKWCTLTNSLAYYCTEFITSVKIYIVQAQQSHFYLKFTLELKYKVSALTINAPKNWTINQFYQNIWNSLHFRGTQWADLEQNSKTMEQRTLNNINSCWNIKFYFHLENSGTQNYI